MRKTLIDRIGEQTPSALAMVLIYFSTVPFNVTDAADAQSTGEYHRNGDEQQPAGASVPRQMNHQGVVTVEGIRFNGNGEFRFALVDAADTNLWTNDESALGGPGIPATPVSLEVTKGIYSVRLGDAALTNMVEIPPQVFDEANVRLRIWFDDTQGNGIQELTPPHVLSTVPYAARAVRLVPGADLGDLFVQGATEIERLEPGAPGQILQTQGVASIPVWADIMGFARVNRITYTGTNPTPQTITGVGFQPQLIVILSNCGGVRFPFFKEAIMPGDDYMHTNGENGYPQNGVTIEQDGFTVSDNNVNQTNCPHVAWCLRID